MNLKKKESMGLLTSSFKRSLQLPDSVLRFASFSVTGNMKVPLTVFRLKSLL